MTTSNKIIITLLPSCNLEAAFCKNALGKVAIIPTIINNDIPLPIPLSVIFSPNHIAKIVPVTKITIEET